MKKEQSLGVVIGRFQVATLHKGHVHLIEYAIKENDQVTIILGNSAALPTERNPLPPSIRTQAIRESFPDITILEHHDHHDDAVWSERLDVLLKEKFPNSQIILYASRDSFLPYYSGKLPVVEVPMIEGVSGTQERASSSHPKEWNESFRKGVIASHQFRSPISYQAIDIAVVDSQKSTILLGQKRVDGNLWRLIGGFVEPRDESLEDAGQRELIEEAGELTTGEFIYAGSYRVDDWRYRNEKDKVMSALFITEYCGGTPCAGDDLINVAWHPLTIDTKHIVPGHRELMGKIVELVATRNWDKNI